MDAGPSTNRVFNKEEGLEMPWRKLKLSLERPYKDDTGERIAALLDIEPDGRFVYETNETSAAKLQHNLHRIFKERGIDFFDHTDSQSTPIRDAEKAHDLAEDDENTAATSDASSKPMSLEELHAMRLEIMPQLYVALGEMTQAKDILTSLLSLVQISQDSNRYPAPENNVPSLSATMVTKPQPTSSIQTFNSQIVIGSKDEALRKAAELFKSASISMERSRVRSEQYWVNALKIRRSNWRLIPAPLPLGSSVGKGADRTAKDFLISYGLEKSPGSIRRRAIAQLAEMDTTNDLVFPYRQHTRLQVSLKTANTGSPICITNPFREIHHGSLDGELNTTQDEIIEQEVFSLLVKEASNLPTALARVSERLIVIDAAQGIELRFELVHEGSMPTSVDEGSIFPDIIHRGLRLLLLRKHMHSKMERLTATTVFPQSSSPNHSPPVLQPIIDFLQYKVFCERVEAELTKVAHALNSAGISTTVAFEPVGETGQELVNMLIEPRSKPISGEAIVRIDSRHTIRLTFVSPSNLTMHLSQATLFVFSLPQLSQLLMDETERFLLQRICNRGREMSGGTWFIDLNHCVARWEGCVLTFCIHFESDFGLSCSTFRLDDKRGKRGHLQTYTPKSQVNVSLLGWIENIIKSVN